MNEAQSLINSLKSSLTKYKKENNQLNNDIKILLDFKNELESLCEDQNQKIIV